MKITIIGTGYVGLVAGLCFADFGHNVCCLDVVKGKIDLLKTGTCSFYEPGAELLLKRHLENGRLTFTTDKKHAIEFGEAIFIAVGTPETSTGEADMSFIYQVADEIGMYINEYKLIIDKSTVPVGTSKEVRKRIEAVLAKRDLNIEFDVASNPEFLREGKAIGDFTNPDRIVFGVTCEKAEKILRRAYSAFERSNKPFIITTPETAEMIKYASNAFLATKITFINEIANLCEKVGADVLQVSAAMGKDGRISPKFLHPGPGYGGSCFPKDTKALADIGKKYGSPMTIVETVIKANDHQKELSAQKIINIMKDGGTIAILGISFKPETDDIREAPAITIIKKLAATGKFKLRLYDPQAMENSKCKLSGINDIIWCESKDEAVLGASAAAIITEWSEFRNMNLDELKQAMKGNIIFDFRNVMPKSLWEEAGFINYGIGI